MSPKEIAKKQSTEISGYSSDKVQLIKDTIAVGATDNELHLFLEVCRNHKLDPFTRQIHFVKRKAKLPDGTYGERGTIQISIDGFRTLAERTGTYAGNDDPVFDNDQKPTKATVTVWKIVGGVRCPFTATARWSEYVPLYQGKVSSPMWVKMPNLMLGKCAEALALRKAFPESLSGLYSDEEMEQASEPVKVESMNAAPVRAIEHMAENTPTVHDKDLALTQAKIVEGHASASDITEIAKLCKQTSTDHAKLFSHFKVEGGTPTVEQAKKMLVSLKAKLEKMEKEHAEAIKANA